MRQNVITFQGLNAYEVQNRINQWMDGMVDMDGFEAVNVSISHNVNINVCVAMVLFRLADYAYNTEELKV